MTIDAFTTRLRAQPFQPFVIRMADGRSFPVNHPDFVARSPSGRTVVVYEVEGDGSHILDLLLMTELESASANGQQA